MTARSATGRDRGLRGRVALVTGAGRGIGRAHALALAARGATVVVNDIGSSPDGSGRDDRPAAAVVAEIEDLGGRAIVDRTDVASLAGGRAAVASAIDSFGRIDILVNNAGYALTPAVSVGAPAGTVAAPDEAGLDAMLAVHLKAAVGTMAAAFPNMSSRGWGRIVNTVSEVALDVRFAGPVYYGAAKAALWSATLAAAAEGAAHGITVNAVSPGARTRMNAALLDAGFRDGASTGVDLDPGHVAAVVAYLVSDEAADVTGRIVHAAGGQVREYTTTRSGGTALAARIQAAVQTHAVA